jgi:hypothetical protein
MDIIGRLRGDPEDRPLNPGLVVPSEELDDDEYDPADDEGDADNQAEAEKKGKKP